MRTFPLQLRSNQNQRRLKQKSLLKQSLALKSRLPNKSTTSILLFTQFQFQNQITQIEKTETLTRIQILKLEILDLGLGPLALDMRRPEREHKLMNRKISKVLLLRRLLVKHSRVLDSVLLQRSTTVYHRHPSRPHTSMDHPPIPNLTDLFQGRLDAEMCLAQADMAHISIVIMKEEGMGLDMNAVGEVA